MLEIINFEDAPTTRAAYYGGNAGAKECILFDDAVWMVKYPKTTRDLINPQISYTTSPLSEYLGSKVYEILNIPVHETLLGVRKNKIVVACRDFTLKKTQNMFVEIGRLIPFHDLKNSFMSSDLDLYSGTGSETLLGEVLDTINGQDELKSIKGVMERFWDMFVVDAFIGNNDRNNGNWGFMMALAEEKLTLAPVYDNGNAFFNKRSLEQMQKRTQEKHLLEDDAFGSLTCVYKYTGLDNEGHSIRPFPFIRETADENCKNAVLRFLRSIDMDKVKNLISSIPESTGTLAIMPEVQKIFYMELMSVRLAQFEQYAEKWMTPK